MPVSGYTHTFGGGWYVLVLVSGTHTITVTAAGFEGQSSSVVVNDGNYYPNHNFTLPLPLQVEKGDIDGNGDVDLADAIIAFKILSGIDTTGLIRSDYATSGADVNNDNKVDMEEVIYILQKKAGLR